MPLKSILTTLSKINQLQPHANIKNSLSDVQLYSYKDKLRHHVQLPAGFGSVKGYPDNQDRHALDSQNKLHNQQLKGPLF